MIPLSTTNENPSGKPFGKSPPHGTVPPTPAITPGLTAQRDPKPPKPIAKRHEIIGDPSKLKYADNKELFVVDEVVEVSRTSLHTTIVYRPGELLDPKRDKIKIELAQSTHVRLRKRE